MQAQCILQASVILAAFALGSSAFHSKVAAQTDECAKGYVWREAFPGDRICVTPETHDMVADENRNADKFRKKDGNGECEFGYVWRMAGPQDTVCVTQMERDQAQQDNSMAKTRVVSAAPTRHPDLPPPGGRENMLSLPPKTGCFNYVNGAWQEVECVSEEYVKRHFPPPAAQYSIRSNRRPINRILGLQYALLIRLGSAEISHLSDPAIGTVADSLFGKNAFSVQVNTNFFPATNGNTGWVQFVLQSRPDNVDDPADDDILCVWQVDVTVATATANASGYSPTCVNVPKLRIVWGPDDPFPSGGKRVTFLGPGAEMTEKLKVAGYVSDTQGGGTRLVAWAYVPWAPFSAYAVAVADQYGMRDSWTEVSGDIMGLGNGSQAKFSRTKVRTVLQASSCIVGGASFACPQPVPPQFGLANYATSSITSVTAESNNLSSFYDFTAHTPLFSCVDETCTLDYSTGPFSSIQIIAKGP
jgi:hypothetical protein